MEFLIFRLILDEEDVCLIAPPYDAWLFLNTQDSIFTFPLNRNPPPEADVPFWIVKFL